MVVEDNDFVRMQIVSFLRDANYTVIECADAVNASEKLDKTISVVVADIRMEPIDGFEFVKNLRAKNIKTPVILVTGDDTPDLLNEAGRYDVFAVLMKPVGRERLVKIVDRALNVGQD